ncbi:MAG: hypothetical protein H3Z52_08375 [archaeon]|nr:hypothetical protein [archaeon]
MSQIELTATLKAVDEASKTMEKVGNSTKKAMDKVKDSSEKAEFSMKKFTTSISGVMTAGYSLYNVYDRVQDAQLAVSKAQNSLTSAQISAKQAQEAYNNAVEKYGVNSEEAKDALEKLELAQERVATAQESLKDKQDRVNEAMVYGAIQIIPTAITAMVNLKGVVYGLTTAMTGLKVASAAAFGVIGAGIAIVAGSAVLTYEAMKETAAWKEKLEALGMTQEQVDARAQELTATYGNLLKAYTAARQEVEDAYQAFLEQQAYRFSHE